MQNIPNKKKQTKPDEVQLIPPTQIALLLILSEGPAHAWHIKKVLDERGFAEWVDMKKSTIYKSLGRLEQEDYIKGTKKSEDQLSKKIYEITESGQRELLEQIQSCLSNPPRSKSMFDLGLAGLSLLTKSEALSALEKYKVRLDYSIQWFESILRQFESKNLTEIVKSDPNQMIVGGMTTKELQESRHSFVIKALFERPYSIVIAQNKWLEVFIQSIYDDEGEYEFKEE